jgi:hypothetical protein
MTIPSNIKKKDVLNAINEINKMEYHLKDNLMNISLVYYYYDLIIIISIIIVIFL